MKDTSKHIPVKVTRAKSRSNHSAKDVRKRISFFSYVGKTIKLLITQYNLPTNLEGAGTPYLKFLDSVWKDEGQVNMIKRNKFARLVVTRYLSGQPLTIGQQGVKLTKDNLPVRLGGQLLRIARRGNPLEKRVLLTVLYSTRALSAGTSPDFGPITAPNRSEKLADLFADLDPYVRRFFRALGLGRKQKEGPSFKAFHQTTKSGPNGHALWSWVSDLKALTEPLKEDLGVLGGKVLADRITLLTKYLPLMEQLFPQKGKNELSLRRLTSFPDKEDKMRIIAIGDYFSQASLKPIHKDLFKVLRRVKQDCTFDQGGQLKALYAKGGPFHSIDLSNATDRFPISLISKVLKGLYPSDYVDSWERVMTGLPFDIKGQTKAQRYAVGNPMGFYSSWNSFTLAHHFVVFYACESLGLRWKDLNYCLLGDDIVIANEAVANRYKEVIDSLGVDISKMKTHVSNDTFEFAKRWIHRGEEISPFPLGGWKEVCNRYNLSVNFLLTLESKGWNSISGISDVVAGWAELNNKPRRFRAELKKRTAVCEAIMKVMMGRLQGSEAIDMLCHLRDGAPFPYDAKIAGVTCFQFAAMEAFADSCDPKKAKKPLGLLAERLVMFLTDPEHLPNFEEGFELIQSIPILNVYGAIEETFLRLKRTAFEVDAFKGGDWPLLLKAMTIPSSDEVFSVRNFDVLPMAAANVGKRIYTKIDEFISMKRRYPNL